MPAWPSSVTAVPAGKVRCFNVSLRFLRSFFDSPLNSGTLEMTSSTPDMSASYGRRCRRGPRLRGTDGLVVLVGADIRGPRGPRTQGRPGQMVGAGCRLSTANAQQTGGWRP